MPEAQVRQFIDAVLKAGGVEAGPAEDPRFTAAEDAMMVGDLDAAEQAFKKILGETPNDSIAEAGLAQVGLMRRVEGKVPAKVLAAAEESPDDVEAQTLAADVEVLSGLAPDAYKRLVGLVRRTAGDERETARKHLVSLFTIAGPDDPDVASARRALASALF
jgi:putative thioredoxin